MNRARFFFALSIAASSVLACGSGDDNGAYQPPGLGGPDAGVDGSLGPIGNGGEAGPPNLDATSPGFDASSLPDAGPCMTTFTYVPPAGQAVQTVAVSGEWNAFATPGVTMNGPDKNNAYTASVQLPPGLVGYKLLIDGTFVMDPAAWERKFVGGVENSAVMAVDCRAPTLSLADKTITRASAGAGEFFGHVRFNDGQASPPVDPKSITASLRKDGTDTSLPAPAFDAASSLVAVDVKGLADGKYTIFVNAKDLLGNAAKPLRLVFWVEPEVFDWRDALIYMAMTDRFQDGDPTNNPAPTNGVDVRVDYQGGDLTGVTARINDGTFDQLGVRALWLSPFNTNPPDPWLASDGAHETMGYHGYWATKAREVDARIGGDAALHTMVTAAHAHGIRVIQDFMVGDVHQEHEYVAAHPDWFVNGCVCGTNNCDWTVHRLDCVFSTYLPRVDWTNPDVSAQWQSDAIWWVDTFDLDGFRIDAVKQVQDDAITNVSWAVRNEFEASGLKFFMTGETAMGWNACTPPDCPGNEDNYGIISEYIGPHGLDGSFDFVLYYAVPSQVFMNDNQGMGQADYWTQASQWEYPQGSIMSSYIGSQDTPRFVTEADTSGGNSLAGNQWSNIASAPTNGDAYGRMGMAMEWLLTTPGAPMIYYGDEIGQYGSADPNNRLMWRGGNAAGLSTNEQATLALVRKLGTARRNVVALRRGAYKPITSNQNVLLFARQTDSGQIALVGITRATTAQSITATLPVTLPLAEGTTLHDSLGGPDVTVTNGAVTLNLAPRGAAVLAP